MALAIKSLLIAERIKARYREVDAHLERTTKQIRFACKKKCDYCCYQIVGLNFPEALVMVEAIRSNQSLRREFVRKIPELKKQISLLKKPGMTNATYFEKQIPCIFLKNRECSIYDARPLACRTQFAAEKTPDRCKPSGPGPVKLFNNKPFTKLFVDESIEIGKLFGTYWFYSPLQVALLDAWKNGAKKTKLTNQEQLEEFKKWSLLGR